MIAPEQRRQLAEVRALYTHYWWMSRTPWERFVLRWKSRRGRRRDG